MSTTLQIPTAEGVKAACERLDAESEATQAALTELFQLFPQNDDLRHVLLKVGAVNSFHCCSMFAMFDVARNIQQHAAEIDAAIQAGSPEVIEKIAVITVKGKVHNFYSFATKYCNWHQPNLFPIYDSRIDSYLWDLQQQNHFAAFPHTDLCNYAKFRNIMIAFRDFHGLGAFTFKDIDRFLHPHSAPPALATAETRHAGPAAFDFYAAEEVLS